MLVRLYINIEYIQMFLVKMNIDIQNANTSNGKYKFNKQITNMT